MINSGLSRTLRGAPWLWAICPCWSHSPYYGSIIQVKVVFANATVKVLHDPVIPGVYELWIHYICDLKSMTEVCEQISVGKKDVEIWQAVRQYAGVRNYEILDLALALLSVDTGYTAIQVYRFRKGQAPLHELIRRIQESQE